MLYFVLKKHCKCPHPFIQFFQVHYPVGNHTLSQTLNTFCDLNTSDNKSKPLNISNQITSQSKKDKTIVIKCLDEGKKKHQ